MRRHRLQYIVIAALALVLGAGLPAIPGSLPGFPSIALGPTAAGAQTSPSPARSLTLESIQVTGNARTPVFVVERHLELSLGAALAPEVLEAAREKLLQTGYFRTVDLYTRRGSSRGAVILDVVVEERGNPAFETGFGYHDLNGWFLTLLGVRFNNSLGADSQTRIGVRFGFRLFGADAEWRKPISSDGRWSLGVKLGAYTTEQIFYGTAPPAIDSTGAWTGFSQSIGRGGLELAFGYAFTRRTRIELGWSSTTAEPQSEFRTLDDDQKYDGSLLPPEIESQLEQRHISGGLVRVFHDTRNNDTYPTRGTFARATLNVNGTVLGGDEIFTKLTLDLRQHVHLGSGVVASGHASGGITTEETPYYERFYLGGNYSVRGFRNWSLSPTGGDSKFWTINTELRWPMAGRAGHPKVVGLVFLDAGQGATSSEWFTDRDVFASIGYGVRVMIPWLGTLGLDAGVPFTESPTNDPFGIHLLLGFSF